MCHSKRLKKELIIEKIKPLHFFRVPHIRARSDGDTSKLSYTPQNTMDYGTLLCSASNTVGEQRKPCVFHIIMAGKPSNHVLLGKDGFSSVLCIVYKVI